MPPRRGSARLGDLEDSHRRLEALERHIGRLGKTWRPRPGRAGAAVCEVEFFSARYGSSVNFSRHSYLVLGKPDEMLGDDALHGFKVGDLLRDGVVYH